jgi:hypothetical protein
MDEVRAELTDRWPLWFVVFTVTALVLHFLTWQWGPIAVRNDIDRLEQRIEQLEKQEPTDAN